MEVLFNVIIHIASMVIGAYLLIMGFSNHWYWLALAIMLITLGILFPSTKRNTIDLGSKIEAYPGMPLHRVLNETTLGVHLIGIEPETHHDFYNGDIIHYYYTNWGYARFENYILTDIKFN